jgi:hypothetical protein
MHSFAADRAFTGPSGTWPAVAKDSLHALVAGARTPASACPVLFGLPHGPVVPSAAAICWMAVASAGLTLWPSSLCAAATLPARARTKRR